MMPYRAIFTIKLAHMFEEEQAAVEIRFKFPLFDDLDVSLDDVSQNSVKKGGPVSGAAFNVLWVVNFPVSSDYSDVLPELHFNILRLKVKLEGTLFFTCSVNNTN